MCYKTALLGRRVFHILWTAFWIDFLFHLKMTAMRLVMIWFATCSPSVGNFLSGKITTCMCFSLCFAYSLWNSDSIIWWCRFGLSVEYTDILVQDDLGQDHFFFKVDVLDKWTSKTSLIKTHINGASVQTFHYGREWTRYISQSECMGSIPFPKMPRNQIANDV